MGDVEPFAGRYELGEVLGSGGSGVVRVAHDTVLDRRVAIKLLRAGAEDETLRARLRAEAQLAGSLHHAGIAQIYDYGEADADGDPTPYIAMQYVEGTSLWAVLRERRTLPVPQVLDLLAQLGAALQVAHSAGIVHRDLKPSNVLLTESGTAVLVDFGIARTADADPLTLTGTLVGTADYVSPEQCAGRAATERSDLYSLGMLAYECLTGTKPFHRETPIATALAHLNEEVPPLTDVAPAVRDLVMAMVAKDPEQRPVSAAAVAARATALIEVGREDTQAMPVAAASAPVTSYSDKILPPAPTPLREAAVARPPWRREALRSRRVQMSAAAVGVALLGTAFVAARPADATTTVPNLDGMSWSQARSALADAGLEAEREPVDDPRADKGDVLDQEPAAGTSTEGDSTVVVSVATGLSDLEPSEVVGETYQEAAQVLVAHGLVPARREVPRPGGDGVTVVTATPIGRIELGTTVVLNVGTAPTTTTAPMQPGPSKPPKATEPSGSSGQAKAHGKAKGHRKH